MRLAGVRARLAPRTLAVLCAAAVSLGAGLVAYGVRAVPQLEHASLDARFSIRGVQRAPEVAVVNVDEKTF